jgi:hypothetical protein
VDVLGYALVVSVKLFNSNAFFLTKLQAVKKEEEEAEVKKKEEMVSGYQVLGCCLGAF